MSGTRPIAILAWGGLAVDLFMMLSGILMTHHYILRQRDQPWNDSHTWRIFWMRRFFRIAPLYYILLMIALAMSPIMRSNREAVAALWPNTATAAVRYSGFDFYNFVAHVTFIFGFLPTYSFSTPLPDWSIGLEMQFYFAFPFIIILMHRFGFVKVGGGIIAVCAMLMWGLPNFFKLFGMPSFLPIKLYIFIIGIWLIIGRATGRMKIALLISIATVVPLIIYSKSIERLGLLLIVLAIFYLLSDGTLPFSRLIEKIVAPIRVLLSCKVSRFLGDTSYGLYLIHLLVLVPVSGLLTNYAEYVGSTSLVRFLLCFVIVTPLSIGLAWLGHRFVEQPGIEVGKNIASRSIES
jgi:peptidoglycan/LPS O-acetylase OafA/YrhL